ncbi:MAG: YifB family Mg chelatase-like AAA ATPase [Planctomycetota bacterium]|nr:YifB family Mg chelatase-like AAA ATPase [Planctomycetota bacterium]MDA1214395.1 YifB family Mg chelatase-like AAA ATPase [Planctomycetota bacterium]
MASIKDLQLQKKYGHLLKLDHTLNGAILLGLDGHIIEIQARAVEVRRRPCSLTQATTITGMATGAVRECLQRIGGAFSKFEIPESNVDVLINLAPADLPKYGTWLDLPLAIIMLQASGYLPDLAEHKEGDYILMGEVGIHGEIRRVPGALSLAFRAKPGQSLIVPNGNEKECALILAKPGHEGCRVYPVSMLDEVIAFFKGKGRLENALRNNIKFEPAFEKAVDFGRIKGQTEARRAAVVSAAGGHNLLLIGPPGEGKSLIASAIPGILPKLNDGEKVELTKIYSACGKLNHDAMAVTRRPMRSIHHTASQGSLIGGGSGIPKPGEITLAHLGVLFLDELPEFPRSSLEALRQPIEQGTINISRVGASLEFPCRFTMVAAMNPCPCGFFGTDRCRCPEADVDRYLKKLSGPLLDRIDLQVELKPLTTDERFAETEDGVSSRLRAKVEKARERQQRRFEGTQIPFNAAMPGGHVRDYCQFSNQGFSHFKTCIDTHTLSTRSMDRLAKVSRTIADIDDSDEVNPSHIEKAVPFLIGGLLRERF